MKIFTKILLTGFFILTVFFATEQKVYSQQSLQGQAFMNQRLALLATSGSEFASLNQLQRVTFDFNVVVLEGMEALWERIRTAYNIRVQPDWIVVVNEKQLIELSAPILDGRFDALVIAPANELINALVMGSGGGFAFVADPRNVLGRNR
ncbi:MAG: hypothetical protein FWH41_01670 [Treponema sp.]|nr:hypothetical protein [Treponema sp.]